MMLKVGDNVAWKWGNGQAKAEIIELHKSTASIEVKGTKTTRHGTSDDPAIILRNDDGTKIIKLASEVKKA